MAAIRVFEKASHASVYSKYRPTYPKDLLELLLGYVSRSGAGRDLAVDVACGSGQSTFQLQDHFSRCIGVDVSSAQIKEAQEKAIKGNHNNVTFLVGDGAELPLEGSTVDLVTIAQAWHWLPDVEKFYSDCKRVLKPRGCLAVYGYGNVCLLHEPSSALVKEFYTNTLKGCWRRGRRHIDSEFSEVVLPFTNLERHDLVMSKETTLKDFIGYVSSWSGYQKYYDLNPDNAALNDLQASIMTELGDGTHNAEEIKVNMEFPLFIILGQNYAH